jgi:hypothetical protein
MLNSNTELIAPAELRVTSEIEENTELDPVTSLTSMRLLNSLDDDSLLDRIVRASEPDIPPDAVIRSEPPSRNTDDGRDTASKKLDDEASEGGSEIESGKMLDTESDIESGSEIACENTALSLRPGLVSSSGALERSPWSVAARFRGIGLRGTSPK